MADSYLRRSRSAMAVVAAFVVAICFKLLYFDFLWALDSTFSGFQFPIGYVTKLAMAILLTLPLLLLRSRWYIGIVALLLDGWLVANLMYFRTYFTIIPASSYGLIGNLADFQDSVWESLRLADVVLPVSSLVLMAYLRGTDVRTVIGSVSRRLAIWLGIVETSAIAITAAYVMSFGGYKEAYSDLMYDYSTCGAAVYTIPGAMAYEWIKGDVALSPEVEGRIDVWLAQHKANTAFTTTISPDSVPQNCIILLLESFESWTVGASVENQEITPNINRLLAEQRSFFAPKVVSQVRGARSIDAQLIVHTGLLPVNYGAYSYRFAHNVYPSIDKAWKARYGDDARSYSFTVDKRTVWNVAIVAQDFGYTLFDKPNFVLDERTGPRHRLGDMSFLRQAAEKIADDDLWSPNGHTILQCVTYSGHTPFIIPDESKRLKLSASIPERLRNYLQVANYTDRAIGAFVDSLRCNPKFSRTMIVILGDHEGLGAARPQYIADPIVGHLIPDEWYTPFIVLNSPIAGRYDATMGQIDIYPSLLNLLGLGDYPWHGMGQSIFCHDKSRAAAHTIKGIVGEDADSMADATKAHMREAFDISDLIISSNFFKGKIN